MSASIETFDPTPDLRALRDAVEASGGVYLEVEAGERLLAEVGDKLLTARTLVKSVSLWNAPWLVTAFLAAVVAGWMYCQN